MFSIVQVLVAHERQELNHVVDGRQELDPFVEGIIIAAMSCSRSLNGAGYNLKVTKEKDGSSIQVQFYSENEIPSSFPVVGKLVFWDKQGVVMEKVPFQFTYKNGSQLIVTQLSVKSDVTGYEWATLEDVFPTTNHELPYPVDMIMSSHDTENKIRYGIKNSQGFKLGDHTLFQMYISSTSEKVFGDLQATAAFYDEANKIIRSAIIHTRLNGLDGQLVDISGQGDLTNYRTVLVNVDKFVPETH